MSAESARLWRLRNPEKVKQYRVKHKANNKECDAEYSRSYRTRHPEKVQNYDVSRSDRQSKRKKTEYYRLKQEAIAYMGGKCIRCYCQDVRCLEIDHILPIRGKRELFGNRLYRSILQGNAENLQVLCACCHAIKTYEDGNEVV